LYMEANLSYETEPDMRVTVIRAAHW